MEPVTKDVWKEKMANLFDRRHGGDLKPQAGIDDYKAHLDLCKKAGYLGKTVIDIGAGEMKAGAALKEIGWEGKYVPVDPFPEAPEVANYMAEDLADNFRPGAFDTGLAFAMLDGVLSLEETLAAINSVIGGHLIVLTGVNIEPDRCHTHLITFDKLDGGLPDMQRIFTHMFKPNVCLLIYKKKLPTTGE